MANTKVTGDVIANGTISTVHIADDAITAAKLDSTATGITFADLTVDTDTLYVDSANNRVGIKTTLPAAPLDVNGNVYIRNTGALYVNTLAGYTSGVITLNSNTNFIVPSGLVGIGVTSLDSMLTIQGNETGGQTVTYLHLNSGNNNSYPFLASLNSNVIASGTYGWTFNNSSSTGNLEIGRRNNSTTSSVSLAIARSSGITTFYADINVEEASTPTIQLKDTTNNYYLLLRHNNINAIFDTHASSYYEFKIGDSHQMSLTTTGLGIGTTSPSARLSLGDAAGQQFYVYEGGNVRSGLGVDLSGSSRELSMFCSSSTGYSDGNISFGYRLESNGAYQERMRLTSAGLLGIGTASPSQLLSLRDDSTSAYPLTLENINIGTAGTHTGIRFGYINNTYQKGAIIFEGQDGNGRGKMYFAMEGTADSSNADETDAKMTIDYSGNVGIGTTSPVVKLNVVGSAYFSGNDAWNGGGSESNRTDIALIIDEGDTIYTRDSNQYLRTLIKKDTGDNIQIGEAGTSLIDNINFFSGSSCSYTWYNNSSLAMKLTSTGLGIGVTSPSQKLDVNGNAKANGFLSGKGSNSITASGTADIINMSGTNGIYTVAVRVAGGSDIYIANAVFISHGSNSQYIKAQDIYDGSNVTLSVSGTNVRITNDGFGTLTWEWSYFFQPFN